MSKSAKETVYDYEENLNSEGEQSINSDDEFEKTLASNKRAKTKKETKKEKFYKKLIDPKIGVQKIRNQMKGTTYQPGNGKHSIKKLLGKYEQWTKTSFPENSFDVNLKLMEGYSKQISSYIVQLMEDEEGLNVESE
eukprot:gene224-4470_t